MIPLNHENTCENGRIGVELQEVRGHLLIEKDVAPQKLKGSITFGQFFLAGHENVGENKLDFMINCVELFLRDFEFVEHVFLSKFQ